MTCKILRTQIGIKPVSYDQVNEMKAQISDTERQLDMAQVDKLIGRLTVLLDFEAFWRPYTNF